MSFDPGELQRGKDVFAADGTYLGTVVWIVTAKTAEAARPAHHPVNGERPRGSGSTSERATADAPAFSGEAIGPMPTAALGNSGPGIQSASTAYASMPARAAITCTRIPTHVVVLRLLTSLKWSTVRPRVQRIPVSLVQAAAHERIVLSVTVTEPDAYSATTKPTGRTAP